MTSITVRAFAKINLYLKILAKRPDGFHDIETVMQNISLYDRIFIESGGKGIVVVSDHPAVPSGAGNICYKAAQRLMKLSGEDGVRIKIEKNIPSGAGLGGGSSDAAAVISALNKLWELSLETDAMMKIASDIGSDVPFFISGGRALCRGRGDLIEKLPDPEKAFFVLIKPDESVPTKWAYEEYDRLSGARKYECLGSKAGGILSSMPPSAHCENDFEKVVLPKYPAIKKTKELLLSAGAKTALLTGSGSAVFCPADDKAHAEKIFSRVRNEYAASFLVSTVDRPVEIL